LLGALAREFVISIDISEFTANIVFGTVTALGLIAYAILTLLIEGLFITLVKKLFPQKKQSETPDSKNLFVENFDRIRTEQQRLIDDQEQVKKDIAIKYTQKEFAPYTSDEDLALLCRYVGLYAEKKSLNHIRSVKVKILTSLDIYHYGWNIWNHFKVSKQMDVVYFLKKVFPDILDDVEIETIKRHLKDEELKGAIKIRKSLLVQQ
jgi:hypothetical protein